MKHVQGRRRNPSILEPCAARFTARHPDDAEIEQDQKIIET